MSQSISPFDDVAIAVAPTAPVMPHSKEAEQAVLGAILVDGNQFTTIALEMSDFYIDRHKFIWRTMQELHARHIEIDYLTVSDALAQYPSRGFENLLDEIGGPAYVMTLVNQGYTTLHADSYAALVKQTRAQRDNIKVCMANLQDAWGATAETLPDVTTRQMQRITGTVQVDGGLHHWKEDISQVYDLVNERMNHPSDLWGIPTGLRVYDNATGGLQKQEVLMISGAPGAGKSLLFSQILRNAATGLGYPKDEQRTHTAARFSLEMSDAQVTIRDLSAIARIPTRGLKTGRMLEEHIPLFTHAVEVGESIQIYQTDRTRWTPAEIYADMARLKAKLQSEGSDLDIVGIDYFMLLVQGLEGPEKEYEKAGVVAQMAKAWAKELNVALILINSVTKDGFGSDDESEVNPNMGDSRGGAQVIHAVDILGYLTAYRPPKNEHDQEPAIPKVYWPNMKTWWFKKGRDMENPNLRLDLIKGVDSPWFADAFTDERYLAAMKEFYGK